MTLLAFVNVDRRTVVRPRPAASRAFQFAIRIDSIRYANRLESIRFVKKSAFRFTSCHAAFLANLVYILVSAKNKLSLFAAFNTLEHRQKQLGLRNAYYKNYS